MYIHAADQFNGPQLHQYYALQTSSPNIGARSNLYSPQVSLSRVSAAASSAVPSTPSASRKSRFKQFLFGSNNAANYSYTDITQPNRAMSHRTGSQGQHGVKRPLRCPMLQAPDYLVDPQIFIDKYVEVEAHYMGILKDIQKTFPLNSRQVALTTIDRAKQMGQLPYTYQPCDEIIVSLSLHNVKFLRRDNDSLILRIFLHEIDSVAMVNDCAVTYVLIKVFPTSAVLKRSSDCRLIILKFVSGVQAEEFCALFKQLFAILFSESAIRALVPNNTLSNSSKLMPASNPQSPLVGATGYPQGPNSSAGSQYTSRSHHNQGGHQQSSRASSIAFDTSITSSENRHMPRPTSLLADGSQMPKSNSMFYDSPNYSPLTQSDSFNMSSLPRNTHFHARAYSEAASSPAMGKTYTKVTSTPRKITHSRIHNQQNTSNKHFLKELNKHLSQEELRQFLMIMEAYKNTGVVETFIEDLGALLGTERLYLMRYLGRFLPEDADTDQLSLLLRQQNNNSSRSSVVTSGTGEGNESSSISSQSLVYSEENQVSFLSITLSCSYGRLFLFTLI